MSLAQDIYIQFVDHYSTLDDKSLVRIFKKVGQKVSHHNHSLVAALKDVLEARGLAVA
ncbi:hypothetical protein [Flammeovirga aprica]|uniref:Uncharacterized protein n=1 Tax=Flammeovirga aprica JL-4 TaxID=694437 RepID=A0A7X9X9H4_9BACT|nr:hypothetical protein [Flammeovirga aprica]NME68845.1 hypothetical protein [Flammeovirga aprica JL-4]